MGGRGACRTTVMLAMGVGALGCATTGRFKDQPIVWNVNDDRSIAEPRERPFDKYALTLDWLFLRRLTRTLELRDDEPAQDTNALDEVPDSNWFTNRIGVRRVAPAEAAIGSSAYGPPQKPLTVVGGKAGGSNPGFMIEDARGSRYLVKFDTKENPEQQTGTSVLVNRIFWALGYFVPNDTVFYFSPGELRVAPDATVADKLNRKRKMKMEDVREVLESAPPRPDGRYRATASQFLEGVPIGGFSAEGVRDDDPNDFVPHEHRRVLRGLRVFAAWVNHSDMKEDNTLDMYIEEGNRKFLRHYFIDFGEAFAGHGAEKGRYEDGYEHSWDWARNGRAFFSFGLWKRPWEDLRDTRWPAVGSFSAEHFDPATWREAYPYWPFFEMTAADAYWGAKLVMRFDRKMLEAIVAEARFSDPEAAAYLVDTLIERRDKIGHAFLEAVTPLDHFTVRPGALCAVDLGVRHGLATFGFVQALDDTGKVRREYAMDKRGRVCLPIPNDDRYRLYRLRVVRGRDEKPPMQVHFKAGSKPRILGIVRVKE